jgi:hypothetical protein
MTFAMGKVQVFDHQVQVWIWTRQVQTSGTYWKHVGNLIQTHVQILGKSKIIYTLKFWVRVLSSFCHSRYALTSLDLIYDYDFNVCR